MHVCNDVTAAIQDRSGLTIISSGKLGNVRQNGVSGTLYDVLPGTKLDTKNADLLNDQNPCKSLQYVSLLREIQVQNF